jgi:hypothetical protein
MRIGRRLVIVVALALGVVAADQAIQSASARRLAPAVEPALRGGRDGLEITIALAFKPERFHMEYVQSAGRVVASGDGEIRLRGVSRRALETLSRRYWVDSIRVESAS